MANPRTIAKVAARIKERVAYCLEFELSDPRSSFVTVTRVEVSADLATAKVHYSVLGTEGDKSKTQHMLEAATGYVQGRIARVLRTRRTPRIRWIYDDSIEYAARMDEAIRDAIQRDKAINPHAHKDVLDELDEVDPDHLMSAEYEEFLGAQEEEEGPK